MKNYLHLRIQKIISETIDTKTYILENTDNELISYEAGQFLSLILNLNGQEIRRAYSLSSAPELDKNLAITIKKVVNGEVSRYLLEHLQEGDILQTLLPAGRFTLATNSQNQRDIFLIGAGSGITPLFALLKKVLKNEPKSRITLIYGNQNEKTTIFFQKLLELTTAYPQQLRIIHLFSKPSPESNLPIQRLSNELLENLVRKNLIFNPLEAEFYLCGPEDLMRMAKFTLKFMGFADTQIHKENFVVESPKIPNPPYSSNHEPKILYLNYQNKDYQLTLPYNQTILQTALNQGIDLPYSCKGGRCATCVARCVEGQVNMSINDVLTEKDLKDGLILTCVAYAQTEKIWIEF